MVLRIKLHYITILFAFIYFVQSVSVVP